MSYDQQFISSNVCKLIHRNNHIGMTSYSSLYEADLSSWHNSYVHNFNWLQVHSSRFIGPSHTVPGVVAGSCVCLPVPGGGQTATDPARRHHQLVVGLVREPAHLARLQQLVVAAVGGVEAERQPRRLVGRGQGGQRGARAARRRRQLGRRQLGGRGRQRR